MKAKSMTLFFAGILSLVLLASFASAGVTFNATGNDATVDQGSTVTVTFTITEDGEGNLTNINFDTPIVLSKGSDHIVSANSVTDAIDSLDENQTSDSMTLTFDIEDTQALGEYTGELTLTGNYSDQEVSYTLPITITVEKATLAWEDDFCVWDGDDQTRNIGNPGDLKLELDDIRVESGFGDDDVWYPFDSIEADFYVENRGNEDINNLEIEWGIYDTDNDKWLIEVDNEKDFDLREDRDDTITVSFDIDNKLDEDLEDLNGGDNYVFYVRATGEVEDDEDTPTCDSDSQDIEIVIDDDFVIVTNLDVSETVSCGSQLVISGDVYNIGEDDQDDVSVRIINSDLNIDKKIQIGDIDAFDNKNLDVLIQIPKDAQEKEYLLSFETYDEDNDIYENSDDDEAVTTAFFNVEGNCGVENEAGAIISANLDSGGFVGEPLVVKALVTNTGDTEETFAVNVAGYVSWANSADLDKSTLILGPGDSDEVTITLDVKDNAVGDQLFRIQAVANQQVVADQPVSVTIQSQGGLDLGDTFGDSWYLWLIGALNVILIVIIIIVAVRISRKK